MNDKEIKKKYTIQFKPSVHAKGKQLAQELEISFQELLERLILDATENESDYGKIALDCIDVAIGAKVPNQSVLGDFSKTILNAVGETHED